MTRTDNYQIQVRQAQDRFLTYDQKALIRKMNLDADETYLYIAMLASPYRIHRKTGEFQRQTAAGWIDANSHGEVMTLLDLICDSAEDRRVSGAWRSMAAFGLLFHRDMLEGKHNPWADRFEADPEGFRRACLALKGRPLPMGDITYAIELFDGLEVALQLWFGDEEFPASLRLLWDANALQYIKYETMWFARGMLLQRLREEMDR